MRLKLSIVSIALFAMILNSCKKQEVKLIPLASLQITNAVNGGEILVLGNNDAPIYNNSSQNYGMLTGSQEVKLVDTVGGINRVYYNQIKDFVNGGVYSLFLTGTPGAVEPIFLKEENILSHTNNVFGVRVINLVTGGLPISVNLQGGANGSFVSNLSYKVISPFTAISSKAEEGNKVFEFRNTVTGDLITTFTVPSYDLPRFRNITLVCAGSPGAEVIFRLNNY